MTISVTSDEGDDGDPTPSGETYGLASADDRGPANIITEDPTCAAWTPINNTLVEIEKKGWDKRDIAIPASAWAPDLRQQYEEVRRAMLAAADQTVTLAKLTTHRVLRELYEQFIAYARAYSAAVPTYVPSDNHLVGTVAATSIALVHICTAIDNGSADARSPLVPKPNPPKRFSSLMDPANPKKFMPEPDPTCHEWDRLLNDFASSTREWQALNAATPASGWTPEERATVDAVVPVMAKFADDVEELGRRSDNPYIQDFASLAAQYRRAYAAALPSYTPADSYLSGASANAGSAIFEACKASGA
ncbi:hypothetical protein [Mycolicibacterium celeriflavum]|uniref:Uncharacterized protein n=1 Tax=Mycolicibacterium celeriflavum TaxID=1249101 RepID=A0A7I7RKZ4_MYCCF|nr:hypothetical protein [Mycolicibacterium celeriflavum]BBY44756.1 hypothetical protein MCEL_30510 [Mycolicibacterium celeriflavum]